MRLSTLPGRRTVYATLWFTFGIVVLLIPLSATAALLYSALGGTFGIGTDSPFDSATIRFILIVFLSTFLSIPRILLIRPHPVSSVSLPRPVQSFPHVVAILLVLVSIFTLLHLSFLSNVVQNHTTSDGNVIYALAIIQSTVIEASTVFLLLSCIKRLTISPPLFSSVEHYSTLGLCPLRVANRLISLGWQLHPTGSACSLADDASLRPLPSPPP